MNTKKLLFYTLAALLGGCVPVMSLHPLYTEENTVFNEKLLGTWVDDSNNIWQFKDPNKQEKAYELIVIDHDGEKGLFDAHLTKLQDKLFLDVYPAKLPCGEEDPNKIEWHFNALFFMPLHTFIKINNIDPELKLQLTDDEDMKKLLDEDPNAVKHEFVKDGFILTASTKELQAFVLKYADDSRLFTNETVLSRKPVPADRHPVKSAVEVKSKTPNEPNNIEPDAEKKVNR